MSQRFHEDFPAKKKQPALVAMQIFKNFRNIKPVPTSQKEKGTITFRYTPTTNLTYTLTFLQLRKTVQ